MDPVALAGRLEAIEGRLVGSDAERRAALACAAELRAAGRRPRVETHWVRPRRRLSLSLYATLGVAASIVAVSSAEVGLGLAAGALLAGLLESAGIPLVSLLQARRATQNVIAPARGEAPVLLVLAASVAAPRDGLLERFRRLPHPLVPLAVGLLGVAACAGARMGGAEGSGIGIAQLVPSVLLIVTLAALIDAELAGPRRGASGAGPAAAVAVARALDAQTPQALAPELVLAGGEPGLRAYRAARRGALRPEDVVVVLLEPAAGPVRFATRHARLAELSAAVGERDAAPPRLGRWPVVALRGDARGMAAAALRVVAAVDAEVSKARRGERR